MHRATKLPELPALTRDFLQQSGLLMDNVFASLCQPLAAIGHEDIVDSSRFQETFRRTDS